MSQYSHIVLNLGKSFFLLVILLAIKKTKKSDAEKKASARAKPRKRSPSMIEPYRSSDLWMDFDRAFERFRRDFENIMWPRERILEREWPSLAVWETNIPSIDIEDRGNDFLVTVEAAGFKKNEIDINVCGDTLEVSGSKETVEDEKKKEFVRKERMSESFYRTVELPEEVKYEEISADLKDGVLEIMLPKKNPKQRKKVAIK